MMKRMRRPRRVRARVVQRSELMRWLDMREPHFGRRQVIVHLTGEHRYVRSSLISALPSLNQMISN